MKHGFALSLISVALIAGCSSQSAPYEDEYDYIETPKADQIADLIDDDRDGVVNARDLCVGTIEGSLVNNDGCGETVVTEDLRQLRILFANDSYEINPVFEDQIASMSDFLKKYTSANIEIQGYASKVGSPEYNLVLSKNRAMAVEKELVANGIDDERVTIVGFGDTQLEATGNDEVSHARNRKVTATVVGLDEEVVEEWNIFTVIEK
ncbi:OmpA family protein [Vibrio sp. LaRot3]|uniref:OmpA family protein n=1 Tax=Vibrio sp. LaRot3 TaxID=2998829 RepID=UPI003FCEAEAB